MTKPKIPKKPIRMTKKNILKYIIECGKILDKQSVPKKNRWGGYWDGEKYVIKRI